jgi:hypothetical protein
MAARRYVALTAHDSPEEIAQARYAGFNKARVGVDSGV